MSQPYEELSTVYDKIMHHVNYRQWARYIKRIFNYYNISVTSLIDLSCGTGKLLISLRAKDRILFGADLSHSMLKMAKVKRKLNNVPLICAGFEATPFKKNSFDVVLILYDSINYIIDDEEMGEMFFQVKHLLKEDGLFIFDVVTPYVCEEFFRDYTEYTNWNGVTCTRHSWFKKQQQIQFNEFNIIVGEDSYHELHRQKIRKISEWKDIIGTNNFELIHAFDNFTFHEASSYSERIHFVCRS